MSNARQPIVPEELLSEAGRLHGIARRLLGQESLAEDLVQDTWVAAIEADLAGRQPWRDQAGWRAWAGAVTRNLALRRRRREGQRKQVEREAARSEAAGTDGEIVERMELQRRLADAICELKEPHRSALVMRYLDGLDCEAIAKRQGISKANARQRVSRALGQLRSELGVEGEERRGRLHSIALLVGLQKDTAVGSSAGLAWLGTGGFVMSVKIWMVVALAVVGISVAIHMEVGTSSGAGETSAALVPGMESVPSVKLPEPAERLNHRLASSDRELAEARRIEPGPAAAEPSATVHGVVLNSAGVELAEVEVQWNDASGVPLEDSPTFTTEADGRFRLKREERGVTLSFRCAKFLPVWATGQPGLSELQAIRFGEEMRVVLQACPRLSGMVSGPNGLPVEPPGEVWLNFEGEDGEPTDSIKSMIGPGGRYLFDELPEGTVVRVRARAKGFDELEQHGSWVLRAEESTTLPLALPLGLIVTGSVRDAESQLPIPFAKVWTNDFEYDEANCTPTTIADDQGRFRLTGVSPDDNPNLPEGMQFIWLAGSSPDHITSPFDPKIVLRVGPDHYEAVLELIPSSCSLRVVFFEAGRERFAEGVHVWAIDSQRNFLHNFTNAKGEMQLDSLPPGKLMLAAYRLERNDQGLYDSALYELELTAGSHESRELELQSDVRTSITGLVTEADGTPTAGVRVNCEYTMHFNGLTIPLDSEDSLTDENGRYRFDGLRAGRHRIRTDRPALPRDVHLELDWGESRSLDLLLGEGMHIRGRVEFGDLDHHDVEIELYRRNNPQLQGSESPKEDGSFELRNLPPAEYELILVRGGERLDSVPVLPTGPDGIGIVVLRVK